MQAKQLTLTLLLQRAESLFYYKTVASRNAKGEISYLDYGQLTQRVRKLITALNSFGIPKTARVASFCFNHSSHLELYFALGCSGRILHTLNIRSSAKDLVFIIRQAEDEIFFVDKSLLDVFVDVLDLAGVGKKIVVIDDVGDTKVDESQFLKYENLILSSDPAEFEEIDENLYCSMCYTSGTTGVPKGVLYSHRSSVLHAMSLMTKDSFAIGESDVIMPVVPMFHVNAWGLPYAAVFSGAKLVLPGPYPNGYDLINLIESQQVTLAAGVPSVWVDILEKITDDKTLSSLRMIVSGGSNLANSLFENYKQRFGVNILQAWGMTETYPTISIWNPNIAKRLDSGISHGIPVAGMNVRIADLDTGEVLSNDAISKGELQVEGLWTMDGYYKDDNQESFTKDGWLRSGDIATIDEFGSIKIEDRIKDLIKSGGEWISSIEIENALLSHSEITQAAVIGYPHEKWGERPLACVVSTNPALDEQAIEDFIEDKLPRYYNPILIVIVKDIPKTSVGKIDKRALRRGFSQDNMGRIIISTDRLE